MCTLPFSDHITTCFLLCLFVIRSKENQRGFTLVLHTKKNDPLLHSPTDNIYYQASKLSLTSSSCISNRLLTPTYSSNDEIIRRYSYRESLIKLYRNLHSHTNSIPIKQCEFVS